MTLDEAIKHAEEVADKKEREKQKWERWLETDSDSRAVAEKVSCELCAEEHRQLAEWLKELKRLREQTNVPATNDGDTISRQAAIDILDDLACDYESGKWDNSHSEARGRMINLPSVEPERKTGRWIRIKPYPLQMHDYECSECLHETDDNTEEYCSACGAKMEVDV